MDITSIMQSHELMAQQIQNQQTINQGTVQSIEDTNGFGDLFVQQLQETNQLQYDADVELQNFMIGESDNLHDVMIAAEEAKISLQFTTQVRNKVMDAYQEIKNMQI